ncbi:MAG: RNA methyltransferase [Bacteroidales bacterium]|nr:RNA methyltransferase [Bacteroidales bacterium]
MRTEQITSAQNPKIKTLLALEEKSRLRREMGLFVVEGRREIGHCVESGFRISTLFVCPEIYGDGPLPEAESVIEVPASLYDRIAYRGGTEGLIAEIHERSLKLSGLDLPENPLVAVLESVEKPGNLGAVMRTADAAGVDAVLVCDPLTDLYNPNLIRSSLGGIFTVPCVACSSKEAIDFLKARGIQILTAQLQDSSWYYDTDMKRGTAIVIGTEDKGLTDIWREAADAHIKIPMLGSLDSLNASVSAAILLFEAVRQRNS